MSDFLKIPETITPQLQELIAQVDELVGQLKSLVPASPSPRINVAFEYLQDLLTKGQVLSLEPILKLHELIGKDGRLRGGISSFFDENNIAIRGYHPAQAEDLERILDDYVVRYRPERPCEQPLLKIGGAYLAFALIHPFKDGNGRVGRLIAAWLMHVHGYEVLAPYLEDWMGNENREHGKSFECDISDYLAWCNPQFSWFLPGYVQRFFGTFLQELVNGCQNVLKEGSQILKKGVDSIPKQ